MGRLVERVDFQEGALDSLRDHVEECALGVSKVIDLTADSEDEVDKAEDLPVLESVRSRSSATSGAGSGHLVSNQTCIRTLGRIKKVPSYQVALESHRGSTGVLGRRRELAMEGILRDSGSSMPPVRDEGDDLSDMEL
jgi:hypothetical protein